MNYTKGWLTLNRQCNLRCKWCYAKDTGYSASENMNIKTAYDIIDICAELKLKNLTLIGGEPTLYPHLFEVIDYANAGGMRTGFISNGIAYERADFAEKLYNHGMRIFSISLKGTSRQTFLNTTGADVFDKVVAGVKNCLSIDKKSVVVFMVLGLENINDFLNCVEEMKEIGVNKFHFSFMYNFDVTSGYKGYLEKYKPLEIINKFKESYNALDKITNGRFKVTPTLPLCAWGEKFILMLQNKNQLSGGCELKERSGLIFDCDGNLLPCNAMYPLKLGKLGVDFTDAKSLLEYNKTQRVVSVYDRYGNLPDEKCNDCRHLDICDSCACQWTNYSLSQLLDG